MRHLHLAVISRSLRTSAPHGSSPAGPASRLLLAALAGLLVAGCSIDRTIAGFVGNALAGGGGVYASEDDPDLIRDAIPFGLKTLESLLAASPTHRELLLGAARGFTLYAYLLQDEADRLDAVDLARARELRARARKLYLRGRSYALRGLEREHPAFTASLRADRAAALRPTSVRDVPFLYWAGVSGAAALGVAKDDLDLLGALPTAEALIRRVLELDETYERGAAHEFLVSYEGSRPGGSAVQAREHYRRALEISRGARASVHLALAEAVTVREQNLAEFRGLLASALAVDVEREPELRLANALARRRAQWLHARISELFLDADQGEGSQ